MQQGELIAVAASPDPSSLFEGHGLLCS